MHKNHIQPEKNQERIVFFPFIKMDKNKQNIKINKVNNRGKTKPYYQIKILDYHTKNEINISEKINQITDYNQHFHIILKKSLVNLTEVDNVLGLVKSERNEPYLFLSYSYVNFPIYLPFNEYFINSSSIKKTILNIINSFKYLLKSLEVLINNKIVHSNLTFKNIVFNNLGIPFIRDFSQSFDLSNINEERKSILFNQDKSIIPIIPIIPIERYIGIFLYNQQDSLSKTNIDEVCSQFFDEILDSLDIFDNGDLEENKKIVIFSLQSYINKTKDVVINDMITNCAIYWDIYCLCLNYLLLMKGLVNGSEKNSCCFFDDFSQLLIAILSSIFSRSEVHFNDILDNFDILIERCDFDDIQ